MICLAEVKRGLHHKNSAWFSGRDCACCPVVRRRQKLHGCAELVHEMYNVTRGKQGPIDPVATCRNDFNGCMSTGTWAGQTMTIKGLEKK